MATTYMRQYGHHFFRQPVCHATIYKVLKVCGLLNKGNPGPLINSNELKFGRTMKALQLRKTLRDKLAL